MNFRILGPLEVRDDDGGLLQLGKRKERTLLALLLVHSDQVVGVDAVIDALWPDGPPARVETSLHSIVARLRKTLEPNRPPRTPPTRLVHQGAGYRLVAAHDEVDSRRFLQAADRGRGLLDAGDAAAAHRNLQAALAEWNGAAFGEFAYEAFADRAAEQLETRRIDTLELDFSARLALGEAGLVPEIEAFVADHPLREHAWISLMIALYRSGRQTEALRRGEELRRTLDDVGLEPSREVRDVVSAILAQDPTLDTGAVAARGPSTGEASTTKLPSLPRWWQPGNRFVGRTRELAVLRDAWRRCRDGEVLAVVVVGEPGIGKSTLAVEGAERAGAAGARILAGRSAPASSLPFEPLGEAFGRLVDVMSDDEIADLGVHARRLSRLLPSYADRLGRPERVARGGDEVERHLLYEAAGALVGHLATSMPTVLVVDDLQWADPEAVQLVDHLLRSDRTRALLVILTIRSEDFHADARVRSIVESWYRLGSAVEVDLAGFDAQEVAELVESESDVLRSVSEDRRSAMVATLLEGTGGNPFFIVEMTRGMTEPDAPTTLVPVSVQALVRGRLDRLDEEGRQVLRLAALQAGPIDFGFLTRILGEESVGRAIDTAVAEGLLGERNGAVAFRHDLVRNVLESEIGPSRRTRWHRALAAAYLDRAGDDPSAVIDRIAHHFVAAAADGDATDAVRYSILAGEHAWSALAYDAAVAQYEAGLEALRSARPVEPGLAVELYISLLTGRRLLGNVDGMFADLREYSDEIERHATLEQLARYVRVFAHNASLIPADDVEGHDARLARIEARFRADDGVADEDVAIVVLARALLAMVAADIELGLERFAEVLAGRRDDWPLDLQVMVADASFGLLGERVPVAERIDLLGEVADMVHRDPTSTLEHRQLMTSMQRWIALTTGDVAKALAMDDGLASQAAVLGMPRYLAGAAQRRASIELVRGHLDEAEREADRSIVYQPDDEFFEGYLAQIAMIRHHQGRAVELVDTMMSMQSDPNPAWTVGSAWMLAEDPHHRQHAATLLHRFVENLDDWDRDVSWLAALAFAARTADSLGEADVADPLIAALEPHRGRVALAGHSALVLGPVELSLAMLYALQDDVPATDRAMEVADVVLDALDAHVLVAQGALVRAEVTARSSNPAVHRRARGHLSTATTLIERSGIRSALSERARRLRVELGVRPTGSDRTR